MQLCACNDKKNFKIPVASGFNKKTHKNPSQNSKHYLLLEISFKKKKEEEKKRIKQTNQTKKPSKNKKLPQKCQPAPMPAVEQSLCSQS